MASSSNTDAVEAIHTGIPPPEDVKEKSEVTYNEKSGIQDVIVDYERQARRQPVGRIRSIPDAFNKQSFVSFGAVIWKFGRFMGPGTIISVAYIDPDNFQTSVSSGAQFKYKLLFMVLVSNIIAVFLQVRLGLCIPGYILTSKVSFCQAWNCHGNGYGPDEPCSSSQVAKHRTMDFG